ncbi:MULTISPECIES: hypothetical protein [Paenarthrobacter]|uniref:hypothetical protein n=1 Tax=Paenarthrobacter TaxID=1742992 RepID=UPI001FB2A7E7|nr:MULTISPECIES: hypothetical protein [Paenarthrobacter]MCW3767267.1 hypothetical protein [Paenarthrobacter sp. PAE-2]UOD83439.1 hypothetical protein MQZ73_20125 [Paenarthrobacter ureafaciens]
MGIPVFPASGAQAVVYHKKDTEAGITSALLNSAQQIGVALGLAVLAGVAATVSNSSRHSALTEEAQLITGYGSVLAVAAGLLVAAGILAAATLPSRTAAQASAPAAAGIGGPGQGLSPATRRYSMHALMPGRACSLAEVPVTGAATGQCRYATTHPRLFTVVS